MTSVPEPAKKLNPKAKSWADMADEDDEEARLASLKAEEKEKEKVVEKEKVEEKEAPKPEKKEDVTVKEVAIIPTAKDKVDPNESLTLSLKEGLDPESLNDTIRVQQADPNSPLYSAKTFEELNLRADLLKGIYGMKFIKPSKIQEVSLPLVLQEPRRDFVGQAQSGTGKTACFTLSMLSTVDLTVPRPQCICVAPTRELVRQIMAVVIEMSKYTTITTRMLVVDSVNPGEVIQEQVVVGTSGIVSGLIMKRCMPVDKVKMFVLDEADEMIRAQGQGDKSMQIRKALPKECQVLLFSATFPPQLDSLILKMTKNPNRIVVEREKLSVDGITQLMICCKDEAHKLRVLSDIYGAMVIAQSIIFCETRDTADMVTSKMLSDGHTVGVLHGKLSPEERDSVIDLFRSGQNKVLVTTNVLSRGIDVRMVTLVVNYDVPVTRSPEGKLSPDTENYLHRIGRSGRFGRKGVAVNLVHDKTSHRFVKEISEYYKKDIKEISPDDTEQLENLVRSCM